MEAPGGGDIATRWYGLSPVPGWAVVGCQPVSMAQHDTDLGLTPRGYGLLPRSGLKMLARHEAQRTRNGPAAASIATFHHSTAALGGWDRRGEPMHGSIYTIDFTLPPYMPYYAVNRTRANVFLNCRADLTCARVARVILGAPMALGCVFLG